MAGFVDVSGNQVAFATEPLFASPFLASDYFLVKLLDKVCKTWTKTCSSETLAADASW
jgi:hypothetical protein